MRGNGVARGEKDWFSPAPKPYRRPDDRYPLDLPAWSRTFASLTFERRASRVAKLWLDFLNPDFRESGNQVTCPFIHVVLLHDVTEEPHSRLPFFRVHFQRQTYSFRQLLHVVWIHNYGVA